jgi:hypothetical protein
MTADGFHQSYGSAQCALLAILNALNILFGPISEDDAGHIQAAMARTLEGTGGRDLATVLFEDGTGRAQARRMLRAAQAWTASMGWRPFLVDMQHPKTGERAVDFWKDIAGVLAMGRMLGGACAVVGFGSDDRPTSRYAPHWTCVERIGERSINLRDSTDYGRVRIAETGIRPEHGWAVADCFVVSLA